MNRYGREISDRMDVDVDDDDDFHHDLNRDRSMEEELRRDDFVPNMVKSLFDLLPNVFSYKHQTNVLSIHYCHHLHDALMNKQANVFLPVVRKLNVDDNYFSGKYSLAPVMTLVHA